LLGLQSQSEITGRLLLPCTYRAALEWVADNAVKPAVASLSLGVPAGQWSRSLEAAVKHVIEAGVPVVVAAGNSAVDACEVAPARGAQGCISLTVVMVIT
jgi:subtilisin family serine protease